MTTRITLRRTLIACAALTLALVATIVASSLIGSEHLPASASLCAIFTAGTSPCGLSRDQYDILFQLRLPRILLAAAVGGSLATAGASYQALLRNPLAEPYLLGVSNGAAVGTMIALVFFGAFEWSRPVLAFAGALIATMAVYQLARGRTGAIGFSGKAGDTLVKSLSGGEKARLLLGLATFFGPNMIILDEPTNHLDIDSRAALAEAINDSSSVAAAVRRRSRSASSSRISRRP